MPFFLILCKGLLLGLLIAAPVGAIGALCIRNTLINGFLVGMITGLGAATADALYGVIAAYGFTIFNSFLLQIKDVFNVIGGFFLCYLGIKTFVSIVPDPQVAYVRNVSLIQIYISTFLLTLTNPGTILAFAAIFSSMNIATNNLNELLIFIAGVFIGSTLWWFCLAGFLSIVRKRVRHKTVVFINQIAGVLIFVLGILVFLKVLVH